MSKVSSILVVRLSAIGDLILVAPITAQLASEGHRVTLLCKDAYRSVATCLPGVARYYHGRRTALELKHQPRPMTML